MLILQKRTEVILQVFPYAIRMCMSDTQIVCELCHESLLLDGKTPHGTLVSHRKMSCPILLDLRKMWTREKLLDEYVVKGRSALSISQEMGFSRGTNFIDDLLRKYDIPKKTSKSVMTSPSVQKKRIETTRQKYGVDNTSQLESVKDLIKAHQPPKEAVGQKISTALRKHTNEEWKEIRRKASITFYKRYGIHNIAQREDVRQKMSMTRRGFLQDQVEAWQHDKLARLTPQDVYPEIFSNRRFRTRILDEQSWCCGLCGVERNSCKRFPLHHIDRNKANCDRRNLMFLCAPCHGRVHGKPEHFELMKVELQSLNDQIIRASECK